MKPSRADLIQIIRFALWKHFKYRPKTRSIDDHSLYAQKVVDHMELCGVEVEKREPRKLHGGGS